MRGRRVECRASLFVDSHTIGITKQTDPDTVKALFTRNGGEPIDDSLIH